MPDSTKVSLLDQIGLSDGLSRGAVGLLVVALVASVGSIETASAILAASKAIVVDRFDFGVSDLHQPAPIVCGNPLPSETPRDSYSHGRQ